MSNHLTRIIIGAASAEVALVKSSVQPPEIRHETRTVTAGLAVTDEADSVPVGDGTPFEDDVPSEAPEVENAVVPATITQCGVRDIDGRFVDLTDKLREIDERTRIEGMTVECTIGLNMLPRTWVRDSYFIVPTSTSAADFLAHIWAGLTPTGSAAVVRWTKRTDQYLGAIVARGSALRGASLVLIQFEWSANMRPVPENARLDIKKVPMTAQAKAEAAFRGMRQAPRVIVAMRNERAAQRAELLEAAREGREWNVPEVLPVADGAESLGDALLAAVR